MQARAQVRLPGDRFRSAGAGWGWDGAWEEELRRCPISPWVMVCFRGVVVGFPDSTFLVKSACLFIIWPLPLPGCHSSGCVCPRPLLFLALFPRSHHAIRTVLRVTLRVLPFLHAALKKSSRQKKKTKVRIESSISRAIESLIL